MDWNILKIQSRLPISPFNIYKLGLGLLAVPPIKKREKEKARQQLGSRPGER